MAREKHYRKFGPINVIDEKGRVIKEIRPTEFMRIRKDTGEVLVDDEKGAQIVKEIKEKKQFYGGHGVMVSTPDCDSESMDSNSIGRPFLERRIER